MQTIIKKSLKSCSNIDLDPKLKSPLIKISKKDLLKIENQNKLLLNSFKLSCENFIRKLSSDIVVLLSDSDGTLISVVGSKEIVEKLSSVGLEKGVSFSENSIGTNSISIAMEIKKGVYLEPDDHYCDMLKKWHCYATPLIDNNQIIGYIDISSLNSAMKDEIKVIAELLPYKIIHNINNMNTNTNTSLGSLKLKISNRQNDVMQMIVSGLTEKEIATKLFIALPTVKYHKSKIFEKLDVKNTNQFIKKYYEIENSISIQ